MGTSPNSHIAEAAPGVESPGRGRPRAKTDPNQCTRPGCARPKSNTESSNPWCKECWAEYFASYSAGRRDREYLRGHATGVRAMGEVLAGQFERFGSAMFSGIEVANMIRAVKVGPVSK